MTEETPTPHPDDQSEVNKAEESANEEAGAEENPSTLPLDSLAEQLEAAIADRDQNYERWIRSQAETENVRRRSRQEAEDRAKYQAAGLAAEILMPLDNLKRAIDAASNTEGKDDLLAGLSMVVTQFETALKNNGVTVIATEGEIFDPNKHEALQQVPTADAEPMTILQEVETGYMIADRVLRPGKVIVAAAVE